VVRHLGQGFSGGWDSDSGAGREQVAHWEGVGGDEEEEEELEEEGVGSVVSVCN